MKTATAPILTLVLALSCGTAYAQHVYKCPGPNGRTLFQQVPCEDGTRLDINAKRGVSKADIDARQRTEIRRAIARGEPILGMNYDEVVRALGNPTSINAANYGGTYKDQLVFRRPDGGTWYVYTTNGIVDSIQHSTGSTSMPAPAPARPRTPCPSDLELRNARVSANSITPSEVDVERYKALIRQRETCMQ